MPVHARRTVFACGNGGTRAPARRRKIAALAVVLAAWSAAAAAASERRVLRTCSREIAQTALAGARAREQAVARCVADALACPAGEDEASAPCIDAAGRRCRARLARLDPFERRAAGAVNACAADLAPDLLLDDVDGLGYALLPRFCPRVPVREESAADAVACQRRALTCTSDRTVAALAPRTAELLARIGVSLVEAVVCLVPHTCGNALLDPDEECDFGPDNSNTTPNTCRTSCLAPWCGDGVVDEDEDCDDGNAADGDGCDEDCFDEDEDDEACGDGIVDEAEECDDGNVADGDGCDEDCLLEEEAGTCGDGVEDDDEECDDGPGNSDVAPDHCRTDCTLPWCGDRVVDPDEGEECEPPGTLLCDADCELRLEPPFEALGRAGGGGLCGRDVVRKGMRLVRKTRAVVGRCVQAAGRCVLGWDGTDACLAEAAAICRTAAARRARLPASAVGRVARACRTGEDGAPLPLASFLDAHDTLGLRAVAARCPFDQTRPPTAEALLACVFARARCLGERAIAETVPRASELLWEVLDEPDVDFPCVVDPTDLEPDIDFGSPGGAFLD